MEKLTLKMARKRAGFPTQAEAAALLGVTPATLCNYETGKTSPKFPTAVKMAALYGRTLDELDFSAGCDKEEE